MKARPILFSGDMVRALLDGRKQCTRRVVKPQPRTECDRVIYDPAIGWRFRCDSNRACPYGVPGDLLWVRETWGRTDDEYGSPLIIYRADNHAVGEGLDSTVPGTFGEFAPPIWRPSIHMPRWASRLTLRVTDVRVERVQDISEEDARAEGIVDGGCLHCGESEPCGCPDPKPDARDAFAWLWMSINGPDSWSDNPWVWVVSFSVHECNVDSGLAGRPEVE